MAERSPSVGLAPESGVARSHAPDNAETRAQLEKILASQCFVHAGRASKFLSFVVGETLVGGGARLKAYSIAVAVFGRAADFDPQVDPLVRVEAGRLRRRLVEYYAVEGIGDPVGIEIRRGTYVPEFHYRAVAVAESAPAAPPTATRPVAAPPRPRWLAVAAVGVAAVVGVAVLLQPRLESSGSVEAGAAAATGRARVAVAPLDRLSPLSAYFDGLATSIAQEATLALGRLEADVVPLRASGALGTGFAHHDYTLTGSVRALDVAHIRVIVSLTESRAGRQIWARVYTQGRVAEPGDDLPQRVAADVAAALAPLGPSLGVELERARSADHPLDLRDCRARYYAYRRALDPAPFDVALHCFEELALRAPESAAAWAYLAMLHLDDYGYHWGHAVTDSAALALGREATMRALTIDHGHALANIAQARLQFFAGEPEFVVTLERVLAAHRDNVDAAMTLGSLLIIAADVETGLMWMRTAASRIADPPGLLSVARAAAALRRGNKEEALGAAREINAPNWWGAHLLLASAASLAGDTETAQRAKVRLLQLRPRIASELPLHMQKWHYHPELVDAQLRALETLGVLVVPNERGAYGGG